MICFFGGEDRRFYITEYGHSVVTDEKRIIPLRVRSTYILHIVISGVCHFSEFDAEEKTAFLISKNEVHDFYVQKGYEHFWFAFDGERIPFLLSSFDLPENHHMPLKITDFDFVKKTLYTSFNQTVKTQNERLARSALLSVLPFLSDMNDSENGFSDSARGKLFMRRNFERRITMRQTAEYVNLSEKHFCRKFKAEYGIPPQKYLLSVRMEQAKKLLLQTDLSVKSVAESVGYLSAQTFSQVYKDYFGCAPKNTAKFFDI